MRQPPTNICPMLAIAGIGSTSGSAECIEDRCAWWNYAASECAIVSLADNIAEVATEMEGAANGS